jgi:hypothetical protein
MSFSEDPTAGAGAGKDPTQGSVGPAPDDVTQGTEHGATAMEDPTQGLEVGEQPDDDPSQGVEVGEQAGEDPTS